MAHISGLSLIRTLATTAVAAWLGAIASGDTAAPRHDPARHLARVRAFVTTTAATADLTIAGATLASYTSTIVDGADGSGASQTGQVLRLSNARRGSRAEARFDIILADVVPGSTVTWTVHTSETADTALDIYSTTDPDVPRLIDRFATHTADGGFTTASELLASGGRVTVRPVTPHLVVAEYYVWYEPFKWSDPQMIDRPVETYSSDDADAAVRQAQLARAAGVDVFAISWQGKVMDWNDRRARLVLDAAKSADMRACMFVETAFANADHDPQQPTDPGVMTQWLEDAVDLYSGYAAYLRVENRPVIFVYWASRLTEVQWRSILAAVRASGRNPIVIGDFYHSRLINALDGEFQYINVSLSSSDLLAQDLVETLRVRTFNLLAPPDRRRIWVTSVSPGYDDRRIVGRTSPVYVDRNNGAVYDGMWRAAVSTAADWIMITTWNEFWENTHIEPSMRYGTMYVDHTRTWSDEFKGSSRARR